MPRTRAFFVIATLLAACSRTQSAPSSASSADSLVLERARCFGSCAAYRLSLAANGRVTFASRNPGDSTRGTDTVARAVLPALVQRANALGFFELPDQLQGDSALCADFGTDNPSATLTIHRATGAKAVVDYHGCYARRESAKEQLRQLRALEVAVDSATGARRWVRPARFP
jgi:hypothetical protein